MDANVVIAIFTAVAAVAALVSAVGSLIASRESNKAAQESRKIAGEQTKALMTAAKASALASRINFYNEQIADMKEAINKERSKPMPVFAITGGYEKNLQELQIQRTHCAWWLDRQSDELGVGLSHPCGSPYDSEVPRWNGEKPATGRG
jgi:hypothetical protein